jgi:hypothetical protein
MKTKTIDKIFELLEEIEQATEYSQTGVQLKRIDKILLKECKRKEANKTQTTPTGRIIVTGKYKKTQGNGIMHQLCECASEVTACKHNQIDAKEGESFGYCHICGLKVDI